MLYVLVKMLFSPVRKHWLTVRCTEVFVCFRLDGRYYVTGHEERCAHHEWARSAGALQQDVHAADEW